MSAPAGDRNLLFGVLALQMDFVRRDDLVSAMNAWVLDRTQPLGQILCARGALSTARHDLLTALVEEHLKEHGGDPQRSLTAVMVGHALGQELAGSDAELRATLAALSARTPQSERSRTSPVSEDGSRFKRLRPHARGGLGEVFVAEDTQLHREVALKEIQARHADDPVSRGRFLLEAEVTGGLEHPGIVPVYGLGTYPDGRPYYAMRFIRGQSLKEAIEQFHTAAAARDPGERRLAFHGLLRRFVAVCNAVGYAHSRGVLHRDLKPANVMLGPFGETLVVDWGLAKAGVRPRSDGHDDENEATTDPALHPTAGGDPIATEAGAVLGTPVYMSPEQAAGRLDEVGPATDVYGLGATLFVLLTGCKPFQDGERTTVLEQVRRGAVPPPRRLKADIPAPLDAICRKAMALRPADRYATVLELAADIEQWLADEPVRAYREPWPVRLARRARRHRTALIAATVFLASAVVALSVGTALIWREQRRTAAERDRAEEQKRLAEEQKRSAEENYALARELSFQSLVLIESSEAELAAAPSFQAERKEILTTAARAFRRYLEQEPDDVKLRQRTAMVYRYAAHFHNLSGEIEAAEPLSRESIRLQEGLVEQFPWESAYREALAGTLRDSSQMQARAGRLREATDSLRQAVVIAETLHAEDPARPAFRRLLATALLDLSGVEYARGMVAESRDHAGRSAELFRGLIALAPEQGHPYDPLLLGAALNRLAVAEREAGRLDAARSLHNDALRQIVAVQEKKTLRINPADVRHQAARFRYEQARTLAQIPDRRGQAETNLTATIGEWEALQKDNPRLPLYREWQSVARQARGRLRADGKRLDEARADFERSRQLHEELVKEHPDLPSYRADLGRAYAGLGRVARLGGDPAAAANWYGKAVDALARAVEQAPDNAGARRDLEEARAELAR
jgi:serine/threonine-protein kinase